VSAVKRDIKEVVVKRMMEKGILPEEGELAGVANPVSVGEEAEQTKTRGAIQQRFH